MEIFFSIYLGFFQRNFIFIRDNLSMKDTYPKDLEYYLAIYLLKKGIGSRKAREAVESKKYRTWFRNEDYIKQVNQLIVKLLKEKIGIIPYWSGKYPLRLKEIADFPALLFYKGSLEALKKRMVTIVGTRNITSYGRMIVRELIGSVRSEKICYVSGLAFGVDSEVHSIALERDVSTIAVVAGGLDQGYPKSNDYLYRQISENGLIISEFPPGRPVVKGMFPMRNRILAGLSEATIVVEAPASSGSLITARYAGDLGRDVYAFPSRIGDKNAFGVNRLISEGAGIIYDLDSWRDVLKVGAEITLPKWIPKSLRVAFIRSRAGDEWDVPKLEKITGFGQDRLMSLLTKCELEGILCRKPDGKYYINT